MVEVREDDNDRHIEASRLSYMRKQIKKVKLDAEPEKEYNIYEDVTISFKHPDP